MNDLDLVRIWKDTFGGEYMTKEYYFFDCKGTFLRCQFEVCCFYSFEHVCEMF